MRTPLYALMFALIEGAGLPGITLIAVQVSIRALSAVAVTWLLTERSPYAPALVGLALAADPISAAASVQYLSESLCTSGLVLATVAVISVTRRNPSGWVLFAAGLTIGCAGLFRPSGVGLALLAVMYLAAATRCLRRKLAPTMGAATVFLAILLVNVLRTGMATFAITGLYLAFPLFIQQLFATGNGPVSATIDHRFKECRPEVDYSLVVADNSNQFVYGDASRCLRPLVQGSEEKRHAMYHAAYLEAAGARPLFFARQMALESARFLGKTASYYPAQVLEFSRSVDFDRLCGQLFPYSACNS